MPGQLNRPWAAQSAAVDNAAATATNAAQRERVPVVEGIAGEFDAAVAAVVALTLTVGSTVYTFNGDFNHGVYFLPFKVRGAANDIVTLALAASGTGGTSGRATVWGHWEDRRQ